MNPYVDVAGFSLHHCSPVSVGGEREERVDARLSGCSQVLSTAVKPGQLARNAVHTRTGPVDQNSRRGCRKPGILKIVAYILCYRERRTGQLQSLRLEWLRH